jgi:hypothetical protein
MEVTTSMNMKACKINKDRKLMFRKSKKIYGQKKFLGKLIIINSPHQNGVVEQKKLNYHGKG